MDSQLEPGNVSDEALQNYYTVLTIPLGPYYQLKSEYAQTYPLLLKAFYGSTRYLLLVSETT